MLTVDEIETIRRAYFVEQQSIRAIARDQHHHRRVVREAVGGASPPRQYRLRQPKPRPVLDPVRQQVDGWLEGDADAPRKQRHTAKRIFDRLVEEQRFAGSERTVREYVEAWKREHRGDGQGFIPLAYAPGAEAQCDWGDAVVEIGGVEQTARLFCLRLCYSLKPFVCAFPATKQECFFAGHAAAFRAFGAVPQRITYDNLTTAVRRVLEGRNRLEQDAFVAFRGHYLFGTHFCLPGKEGAHEKPMVESLVGYARRNFLVPLPKVASWEALNAHLAARCAAEDERTVAKRPASIGALWREEQPAMLPLQRHDHPCCRTLAVKVSRLGLVTFERNRYSVFSRYGGQHLLLRAFAWNVEISDGQAVLARHGRLYGRDGEQLDPLHYLELLERKAGAFELARPIQQWEKTWPPVYRQYLEAMRKARPEGATREFVRILQLHARYAPDVLTAALERALTLGCWSADSVEQLVRQATQPALPPTAIDLTASPTLNHLADVVIPLPDLQRYAPLLAEVQG
jgi:transposase